MTIKQLFIFGLLSAATQLFAVDLELTQGINSALPIGMASFGAEETSQTVSKVINSDLEMSARFKIITTPAYAADNINGWRQVGADSVLSGRVRLIGSNRYDVRFELVDTVANGRLLLAKSYQVNGHDLRALAHQISDEVYQKLTGERGVFSTRIAYIVTQPTRAQKMQYSLEVADVDGYNPHQLLVSSEPIMSPAWSPDGQQIAYVSFEKKKAQIFTVAVETGKRRLVTDFTGINGAPAWSSDGRQLAVVLSKMGTPKIYSVNLANGAMKQLTFGNAIDTEPRYSPDGRSLLFTSGRGGQPQVYRLNLADGAISRMSFEGNYNARASFTPNQKQIVMMHREDSQFNIAVQDLENGDLIPLTFSTQDESPSISPNGRLVVYATRFNDKGVLGIVSIDGRVKLRLPARQGNVQEPAWSPYLN